MDTYLDPAGTGSAGSKQSRQLDHAGSNCAALSVPRAACLGNTRPLV